MSTKFKVEAVKSDVAQKHWSSCFGASVFTHPVILGRLANRVDWLLIKNGEEPFCLWPVCSDENGAPELVDFTYYVGPLYTPRMISIAAHRRFKLTKLLYEAFIAYAEREYGGFRVSLPIGLDDVRAFSWWNFHHPELPKVVVQPRYTAVLDLDKTLQEIESELRAVRRRDAKKLNPDLTLVRDDFLSEDEAINAYQQTVSSGNEHLPISVELKIRELVKIARSEFGLTNVLRTAEGELLHVNIVLRAKGVSNLVLSASTKKGRKLTVSPIANLDTIKECKRSGDRLYDFNGANSPSRADDKHSYGAEHKLFFQLKYDK